jgi:hypothetical protein
MTDDPGLFFGSFQVDPSHQNIQNSWKKPIRRKKGNI